MSSHSKTIINPQNHLAILRAGRLRGKGKGVGRCRRGEGKTFGALYGFPSPLLHCISYLIARRIAPILLITLLVSCASETTHTKPATQPTDTTIQNASTTQQEDSPEFWKSLTAPLHGKQIVGDGSFAVIVPRDDIDLESEMGQIPTSAGIESRFYFWRCQCGKVKVMGEFLACDYESDDVIDALRGGRFTIDSISPILQNTRPNMVSIRFQSEGDGEDIVETLKAALTKSSPHHSTTEPDDEK